MDFFAWPLNTDGFPARWNCGSGWSDEPFVGWIHIISDVVTWASYMAIPILMAYFLWKRGEEDVVFPRIYGLFATFILVCGTVHLIEAVIFWAPIYRLSAIIKLATAVVSAFTAFSLIKVAPAAIALPGLAVVNQKLGDEINQRKAVQGELQTLNDELRSSNSDLEQFAYIASHDMRSPLRGISQLAGWIEEDDSENLSDESKLHLKQLHGRISRMQTLLDDLLAYSQISQNKLAAAEVVDTGLLLDEVIDDLNLPSGMRVVKPVEMPVFDTVRTPLKLVLQNLIGNAVKHHDLDQGLIAVEVDELEHSYQFRVTDDGPGIQPRFHAQIFDMFQRLKSRDETEGTGLGLAIVKKMVSSVGGEVELVSDGRGAEFAFTWPKIQSADSGNDSIEERRA